MVQKLSKEDRELVFDVIKEVPIPILGLTGMIETVSAIPALSSQGSNQVPTTVFDQFKLYVNTFTPSAVSAAAWYYYSNRAHRWISSAGGLIG